MNKRDQVMELIKSHGVLRPKDLVAKGLPKDYLYQLSLEGLVSKVGRGLYELPNRDISEWGSFIEAQKKIPNGIFCLVSALIFHGLTTQIPHQLWVSIENKAWQPKLEFPQVKYIYMSGMAFSECIETHKIEGVDVRVYSIPKTIADCFKYRNKMGLNIAIEALKDGWRQKKFKVEELMHCAKICRVSNVIKPYAETIIGS